MGHRDEEPQTLKTAVVRLSQRFALGYLLALLAAVTADNISRASRLPFWYDEIFTVVLTRLASIGAVVDALRQGADSNPPGFVAIQRLIAGWAANELLGFRLVSITALPIICLALYAFARRGWGPLAALIAALVPLTTVLYPQYAIEARHYCLVVACVALAAVGWQRAPASYLSLIAMTLSLAAANLLHYYAIFAIVPFGLAELTRLVLRREWVGRVWLGLVFSTVPCIASWPLLLKFRAIYASHFFSRPSLPAAPAIYDWFFRSPVFGSVALSAAALSAILLWRMASASQTARPEDASAGRVEDIALMIGFVAMPFVMILATTAAGGGLAPRQALPAILGIALGSAYVASLLPASWQAALVLGLTLAVALGPMSHTMRLEKRRAVLLDEYRAVLQGVSGDAACLPVVVSDGLNFLPLAYARSSVDPEPIALVDPEASVTFLGSDSVDLGLTALRPFTSWQILDFTAFANVHRQYLLYTTDPHDWWLARLVADGYRLQLMTTDEDATVYRVLAPGVTDAAPCSLARF